MDSYIVRVYRRGSDEAGEELTGLVEEVGSEQKKVFRTLPDLLTTIRQLVGQNEADLTYLHEIQSDK
jgi:hypothetical protein